MEIKQNMYVRTNQGQIFQIEEIEVTYYCRIYYVKETGVLPDDYLLKEEIKKASFNLIDLIEIGDYVNGYKIDKVCNTSELNPIGSVLYHQKENYDYEMILGSEIKSIVTHEQFDNMKYEV